MREDFYNGTKLLSLKDINGNEPQIYMCTGNRTAGKTVFFNTLGVRRFKKDKGKFCLFYRFNYELDDCADKFFKDICNIYFPGESMESERRASGIFHELFLNEESCGYAVSLNSADQIKKYAHLLSDTGCIIFDEFQSETNHYCANEIQKFLSVVTSICRGGGQHVRYVPIYMISNAVSMLNPYFVEMGISNRLDDKTRFLRGDGFVVEQCYNEVAAQAQKESGVNRAFARNKYVAYSSQGVYLNDSQAFIDTPFGASRYICTIKYNGQNYGVREYAEEGIIYANDKPDMSHPMRITISTADHQINYVMLKRNSSLLTALRYYFDNGCFRFKNLQCKEAILKSLSY